MRSVCVVSDPLELDLARALGGDSVAMASLARALLPVVHARVYGVLATRRSARGRDLRPEIEDLAQEAMVRIFADGMRVLRGWDAARGLSLKGFVGLVTEREVGHVLRSARRSPFTADPTEKDDLERAAGASPDHEATVATRQAWARVWSRMKAELTPKGLALFEMLVVEDRSVEEVCATCGMQPDAVYAWRSRLLKRVRALAAELEATPMSEPRARDANTGEATES
jgi:RNA polymerase sigma-70 factor (ECF subfamily)